MHTSTTRSADLVVLRGSIIDGSGGPAYPGSVVVNGDRITAIEPEGAPLPEARSTIDATSMVVAPGFIDPHQHSDCSPLVTRMESFLRQGVTTAISGNCGGAGWPGAVAHDKLRWVGLTGEEAVPTWDSAESFFSILEEAAPAINVASLAGHGSIRQAIMGSDPSAPSPDQLSRMRREVERSMEAGALGLSTGLIYAPGFHARTDELIEVSRALEGAPYVSHIRNEGVGVFDAIVEAERIGAEARVPVHISHLKLDAPPMWGRTAELFDTLERVRDRGVDVSADQYPYAAWETDLEAFLPPWSPLEDLPLILGSERARLRDAVLEGDGAWQSSVKDVGWGALAIGNHLDRASSGRTIEQIADGRGDADPFDTFCALLLEDPGAGVIGHTMSEDDVALIRANPMVMVGSDGIATAPDGLLSDVRVHPRYYGTFPRALGRYVREQRVLGLEQAIGAMTSLVADRFGLRDRGRLRPGCFADLTIFDAARVTDVATFEDPHRFPEGMRAVIVNGSVAWSDDGGYQQRAGRVLRRASASSG